MLTRARYAQCAQLDRSMQRLFGMLTPTSERSERNKPESINERIRRETRLSIRRTLAGGEPAIEARLRALSGDAALTCVRSSRGTW